VETSPQDRRRWDVAPLLLIGVILGLRGNIWVTMAGAVLSLAGLVLLLAGLARWRLRTRRLDATAETPKVTAGV
jgi:hypothetical protein